MLQTPIENRLIPGLGIGDTVPMHSRQRICAEEPGPTWREIHVDQDSHRVPGGTFILDGYLLNRPARSHLEMVPRVRAMSFSMTASR